MDQMTRYKLARVSYWLLFIVTPAVALFFILGPSGSTAGVCFGVGIVLVLIGEHGFRAWKRLWKIEDVETDP